MDAVAPPAVVVLDVNETLSDFTALRRRCASVGGPPGLVDRWFTAVLRDGFALTTVGGFATFGEIGRELLVDMLRHESSVEATPEEAADEVLSTLSHLDVHRDVPEGLRRLHAAGVRLVTLTNGNSALTDRLLTRAGLRDLVEATLSVDDVKRWKPAPEPYRHAAEVMGVEPSRAAMVAVHAWDVDGAQRAGLVGAFLARGGIGYPAHFTAPAVRATTFPELAGKLLAL